MTPAVLLTRHAPSRPSNPRSPAECTERPGQMSIGSAHCARTNGPIEELAASLASLRFRVWTRTPQNSRQTHVCFSGLNGNRPTSPDSLGLKDSMVHSSTARVVVRHGPAQIEVRRHASRTISLASSRDRESQTACSRLPASPSLKGSCGQFARSRYRAARERCVHSTRQTTLPAQPRRQGRPHPISVASSNSDTYPVLRSDIRPK